MQDEEEEESERKDVMGPSSRAAFQCCLILVGSGAASIFIASIAAAAFSYCPEGRRHSERNLNVCENPLFFARSAAAAVCSEGDEVEEDIFVILPCAPCETSTMSSAGEAAAMKAAARATFTPSSLLQGTLSRFFTRYHDVTPSCNTAQNIGIRRVLAVIVTAGTIAVGLFLPYLIATRSNRKKRKRSGNESSERENENFGDDRKWYACCLGQPLIAVMFNKSPLAILLN